MEDFLDGRDRVMERAVAYSMIGHGSFYAATPPLPYSFAMNECRIGHRQVGAVGEYSEHGRTRTRQRGIEGTAIIHKPFQSGYARMRLHYMRFEVVDHDVAPAVDRQPQIAAQIARRLMRVETPSSGFATASQ